MPAGDEVLVPTTGGEWALPVLERLGPRPRPYPLTGNMAPDEAQLEGVLGTGARAMLLVHHLGFAQDAGRWRTWCHERSLLLIEDVTQAWGAESVEGPLGSLGDVALFDFRAALGSPGAAGVVVDRHSQNGAARNGDEAAALLLRRLPAPCLSGRRRAHYAMLLERLGDRVPTPFDTLADGAVPFALPLDDAADPELESRLRSARVQTVRPWPQGRPHVLAVPVHHGLRRGDIDRIASAADRVRRRRNEPLRLEAVASVEDIADEWSALAAEAGTVFGTPEWAATWWRHFGHGRSSHLHACRTPGGRLLAVLPLYMDTLGPLQALRFIGHGPGDHQGPLCRPIDRPVVGRALRRVVRESGADLLLGEQLAADEGWSGLLGGRVLADEGNPVLRFVPGAAWGDVLASWSASLRRKTQVAVRRLERAHGPVGHRVSQGGERLAADVDRLMALHASRWGEQETAFARRDAAFHREFAVVADARGWLQLSFLDVAGETVASVYNLRFGGVESQYQQGRDPAWEHASVGFLALVESMRLAHADGMREYRFLRGGEAYKYRFATADPGLETLVYAPGVVRPAALAAGAALPRDLLVAIGRRVRR